MKILFWNIHWNAISDYVARCALEHHVDIVSLAEHQNVDPQSLCEKLGPDYRLICGPNGTQNKRLILFARSTVDQIPSGQLLEQDRYMMWSFTCEETTYNLIALHMVDKRSETSSHAREHDARRIMADLHMREEQTFCRNSIVIGDFNADPFEPELTTKDTFFAVLFKDIVRYKPVRKRGDEEFQMMYNPTLHFLSEETKCYGSYYYGKGFSDFYWHCYDQVLVSSSLIDRVAGFQYLRSIDNKPLTNQAGPTKTISDHLPLLITIEGALNNV